MEYTEKDLVKIAKRENNTKRNYLVLSREYAMESQQQN